MSGPEFFAPIGIKSEPGPGKIDGWNPKYVWYARGYIGWKGTMEDFVLDQQGRLTRFHWDLFHEWVYDQWTQFGKEMTGSHEPSRFVPIIGDTVFRDFDAWLGKKYAN